MKKTQSKIIIFIATSVVIVACYYALSFIYWNLAAWSAIKIVTNIEEEYNKLSSRELLERINPYRPFSPYPNIAVSILVERKEKRVVPILLKYLKSHNEHQRAVAFRGLGYLKDERAIGPLMEIVKKGPQNVSYTGALEALSKMQYEPAFPYVVKLAKNNESIPGIINMIEDFEKPEGIPLLLDRRNKIKDDGSIGVRMNIESYDKAIAHLESIQKEQEQQNKEKSPPTPIN